MGWVLGATGELKRTPLWPLLLLLLLLLLGRRAIMETS
jgi:hypothetical protein